MRSRCVTVIDNLSELFSEMVYKSLSHQQSPIQSCVSKFEVTWEIQLTKSKINALFYSNATSYSIYDFATSDETYSSLVPMGIEAYRKDNSICAQMTVTSGSYFPIIRIHDYQNKPYILFDSQSEGISRFFFPS